MSCMEAAPGSIYCSAKITALSSATCDCSQGQFKHTRLRCSNKLPPDTENIRTWLWTTLGTLHCQGLAGFEARLPQPHSWEQQVQPLVLLRCSKDSDNGCEIHKTSSSCQGIYPAASALHVSVSHTYMKFPLHKESQIPTSEPYPCMKAGFTREATLSCPEENTC